MKRRLFAQVLGVVLFLPIPVVLVLFVQHPDPLWLSLAVGLGLMVGHRLVARPWMQRVSTRKCLWCNGLLPHGMEVESESKELILGTGSSAVSARVHLDHGDSVRRFFTFVNRFKGAMRLGIFLPLGLLLVTLILAATGREVPLMTVTRTFQLLIGLTVSFGAWGYLTEEAKDPEQIPFPVHNFFLLGLRNLLWIFRIVGLWWIVKATLFFLGLITQ